MNTITSDLSLVQVSAFDIKTKRRLTNYQSKRVGGGLRSSIRSFSRQSRTRLLFKARNTVGLKSMLTLTCPDAAYADTARGGNFMTDGRVLKEHLRRVRQWLTRRGYYGFWFFEFQSRGAPHFHICFSGVLEPADLSRLKKLWHKLIGSDCPHHLVRGADCQVLRKASSAGGYAAKYSAKQDQKEVPEAFLSVGRFWGMFGKVPMVDHYYQSDVKELHTLCRVARRWSRAQARAHNYKLKRSNGRGFGGATYYSAAPVVRAYLSRLYKLPADHVSLFLVSPLTRTLACQHHTAGNVSESDGLENQSLLISYYPYPYLAKQSS